jgi:hypothetical protein
MADKKGNLALAGGEKGLLKIWRLCQAFKLFQEVFAHHLAAEYQPADASEPVSIPLEKNHASMRKLSNILKEWKKDGQKYELDWYVWKELVEPALLDPVEAAYFYQHLNKAYDLFSGPGWDENPPYQDTKMLRFDVKVPEKPNLAPAKEIISIQQTTEAIRGKKIPLKEFAQKTEREKSERIEKTKEIEVEVESAFDEYQTELKDIEAVCPPPSTN